MPNLGYGAHFRAGKGPKIAGPKGECEEYNDTNQPRTIAGDSSRFAAQDVDLTHETSSPLECGTGQESASDALLSVFLQTNAGAQKASSALKPGAEVAIRFTNLPDDWRLLVEEGGRLVFEPTKASDPDFELSIPPAAVESICSCASADVGELGVAFFEHIVAKEPGRRIGVKVHSGIVKLTRRGWLGVMTLGGGKVMSWIASRGLRGPSAIAAALGRLKG